MSRYRRRLPQLEASALFLADGGLETTLIYEHGVELPYFAAFTLLEDDAGTALLRRYFTGYAEMAARLGVGAVLEAPTWRASRDWGARLGYDAQSLADANRRGVGLLLEVRDALMPRGVPVVVSGNLGPRGDGYVADARMSADEAERYHAEQVATFAATDADMVAAFTMNYVDEAIGIARAARAQAMPVAISFTVETDGRLPSGQALGDAIVATDAATAGWPAYYMVNCAHPSHFDGALRDGGADWRERIRGVRANASKLSHAELDAATELDAGDPDELGDHYAALRPLLPRLAVVGGCCGTGERHVAAACRALLPASPRAGGWARMRRS
jgi:S-methylmethionine-dependent homocysteine/selenocysteine methylase